MDKLGMTQQTVIKYRKEWELKLQQQAADHPQLLVDILNNTIKQQEQLHEAIRQAYQDHEKASVGMLVVCPECEEEYIYPFQNLALRNQIMKTIVSIHDQESKLLGLFGVKAEFFSHVANVQAFQMKLLDFCRNHLCDADRKKLEELMTSGELAVHMTQEVLTLPS
jgi:hypothetical protein